MMVLEEFKYVNVVKNMVKERERKSSILKVLEKSNLSSAERTNLRG